MKPYGHGVLVVVIVACLSHSFGADGDLDLPVLPENYKPAPPPPPTPPVVPPISPPTVTPPPSTPPPSPPEPPLVLFGEFIECQDDNLIYVIDISWSMNLRGEWQSNFTRESKMQIAKNEIKRSIQGLSPNLSFNIVAYNCSTFLWSPGGFQRASQDMKDLACLWVDRLIADGGTGTAPAVSLALSTGVGTVVLLTDGAPNCGVANTFPPDVATVDHRRMIRNNNRQNAIINVFGIDPWYEYCVDFCRDVATDSGGSYFELWLARGQ